MNTQEIKNKITKARIDMIALQPFFGTLAMRMQIKEMPEEIRAVFAERGTVATLAVDGRTIWYAPEYVEKLTFGETKAAIAHEVLHPALDHTGRRGNRNPSKWNAAGDYVINPMLKDSGFELGAGWLYDQQYLGMNAEQVYNLLPEDDKGGGHGAQDEVLEEEHKKDPMLAEQWKMAVAQAAFAAQQAGNMPGSLQRFVTDLLNPKVDWRTQLRRFVTEQSKNDYSWSRPNRRMMTQGIYMPSLYSESMGLLVGMIDTSGSITQKMLDIFGSELNAIKESTKPERVTVIYCDSEVNKVDEFDTDDELTFEMAGGGGTDFRPPFGKLEETDEHPVCAVYFTDGCGPFPDSPPEYPVLWCMTTDVEPPWGETVRVDLSDEV